MKSQLERIPLTVKLERSGMRYGYCLWVYRWRHFLELPESFIDCTEMDDAEFERFVYEHPAIENA